MDRYELDYKWEWKVDRDSKNGFDIESCRCDGKVWGFDKDPDGQWVKWSDVESQLQAKDSLLEECAKDVRIINSHFDGHFNLKCVSEKKLLRVVTSKIKSILSRLEHRGE